jgi:predicted nucleotidyltransferase
MDIINQANVILKIIFKDFTAKYTITSLSKEINMTRQGTFKILKKLEAEKLIMLSKIGSGKTSTYMISLNWENPVVEKRISVILTEEAVKNERWTTNFKELENKAEFTLIYGSILENPKEANDIDLLNVVSENKNFMQIDKIINSIQKTQIKKIHTINFTETELKNEIKMQNKAFIDAIKKGIILFGQERFIKFVKEANK